MLFRHEYQDGVWIDLEQPTEEEVRAVAREFGIHERFEAELLSPTPLPRVIADQDFALFVLHFPSPGVLDGETDNQEIDLIVGKRCVITTHYELIPPLHELKKLLETEVLVTESPRVTTEVLLEVLFAHFYTSVRDAANHAAEKLARVESVMFNNGERTTIRSISNLSREFLHMEAVLSNQEELLESFLRVLAGPHFFGSGFADRSERIARERAQVARLVATHRAVATELRETNNALLNAKQNEIIKILTVVSFVFLPLALIAKIFAMKASDMPFVDDPNGFWIILGIMFVVALLLTLFVSRKRWI